MTTQAVNVNPQKQFIVTVDEIGLAYLSKIVPMLKYLEVEGMTIVDQPNHHLLVTPKPNVPVDAPVEDVVKHEA